MFERPRSIIGKIFPLDAMIRAIPVLAFLVGAGLFALSYLVYPAFEYPVTHDILKTLSQIILVSGVVGVVFDSVRYIGVFRDSVREIVQGPEYADGLKAAVHDVVHGTDFLKNRTDLIDLWRRVTTLLSRERFPALTEHLHAEILEKYLPRDANFYYRGYDRECTIGWFDKDNGIVEIIESLDMHLHPVSRDAEVFYKFEVWTDSRTSPDIARWHIEHLWINNVSYTDAMKEENYEDEFKKVGLRQYYHIPLSGSDSYRIRRSIRRKACIDKDPVMEYTSRQFIFGTTVRFKSKEVGLQPVFVSVGTDEFKNMSFGKRDEWQVRREFPKLLFPNQGYILFIQRVA